MSVACNEDPTVKNVFHSANSPGFCRVEPWFSSFFQYLQNQTNATNIHDLVSAIAVTFQEKSSVTLAKVSFSLKRCIEEAMNCKGEDEYCRPHGTKKKLLHCCIRYFRLSTADVKNYASYSPHGSSLARESQPFAEL